jgi:hypothetical protein
MHLFVHAILHEESFFSYEGPATERKATNSTKNVTKSMEILCLHYFAQNKKKIRYRKCILKDLLNSSM